MVKIVVGILVALGLGFALGRYFTPPNIQIKEVVKENTVIKTVDRVQTVKITSPDGTIKETTVSVSVGETKKESESSTELVQTKHEPQWIVGVTRDIKSPVWGAQVDRRVFGPIFLGAFGNTNKDFGVALRVEF